MHPFKGAGLLNSEYRLAVALALSASADASQCVIVLAHAQDVLLIQQLLHVHLHVLKLQVSRHVGVLALPGQSLDVLTQGRGLRTSSLWPGSLTPHCCRT